MTPEAAVAAPCEVLPEAIEVDGVALVRWTDAEGVVRTALDRCPHRRAPLSAGVVEDGVLRCRYHGWGFDGGGRCTDVPALGADARVPARARLDIVDEAAGAPATAVAIRAAATSDRGRWLDGDTPGLAAFWHPVCRLAELPEDGPFDVELLGRTWTVAVDGFVAVSARSGVQPAWGVRHHLDHVWLAPEPARAELPQVPEWGAEGWNLRRLSRAEGRYGVGLLLDNQLDAGHFAFVHAGTFGTPEAAALPPAEVERHGTTVRCTLRVPIAARNDARALEGDHALQQHRTMHYAFHAPLWLRLQLDYEELGGSTLLLFAFVPLGAGRARMDVDILFRSPAGFTHARLDERLAFEERVVAEDLHLQGLFDDLRLPLDPAAELSTRADRFSLACRGLLRELLDDTVEGGAGDDPAPR